MAPGELTYKVFGTVGARRAGAPVALGGRQQRLLLAVLLSEQNTDIPLTRLIEALWDDPPPEARRTVMSYVSRLRSALGNDAVVQHDGAYRLVVDDDRVDATRFGSLVDRATWSPPSEAIAVLDGALLLVTGPAFGDLAGAWWALPAATRLDELALVARERRAEMLLAVGRFEDAAMSLDEVLAAHPLRATAVAGRAQAALALGREAEALRGISDLRRQLVNEAGLGLPPSLVELEAEILGGGASVPGRARGYRLGERIGEGAHGAVYRSVQPALGREVAVKVVRGELADDPEFVARFEVEAQVVSRLEHPHIVPLYDFWREPRGAYLVFRLIEGGTLADDLRQGRRWELARVDRLVSEVGGALALAHASSVVHGDVKPSNVLLDRDGRAYLSDFGLAVVQGAGSTRVMTSDRSPYRPPEADDAVGPTVAGDVFGFGAVLHELLAGRPPVVVDGAVEAQPLGVPVEAVLRRSLEQEPSRRFGSVGAMVDAWRSAMAGGAVIPAQVRPTVNPYVGLRPFEEADAPWFHARDETVASVVDQVRRDPVVMVVGASGSGKSSLLHAGVAPRLRSSGVVVASMVPGDVPLTRLRAALESVATGETGRTPLELAASITAGGRHLVVVIDQFEELWAAGASGQPEELLDTVLGLTDGRAGHVSVLAALRADFFDRPLGSVALAPHVFKATVALPSLSPAELAEVIGEPAAAVGVGFERGLEAQLLADVTGRAGGLPLLQFTLHELFERRDGDVIPVDALDELGGLAGSLATQAEAAYESLDPEHRRLVRRLFLGMVRVDEDAVATARRRRRSELPAPAAVIDRFVELRLLAADIEPSTRQPTIEPAHEALIGSWPRLRRWIDDDRGDHLTAQRLESAAGDWQGAGRPDTDLYRGGRLEGAQALVAADWPLTDVERAFVDASAAAVDRERVQERRSRHRLMRLLTVACVAMVLAIVGASVAGVQRREAREQASAAEVASLVSLSRSLVTSKRDLAALLAVRASLVDPGPETDGALMTALYSEPAFLGELAPDHPIREAEITADGSTLWGVPTDSAAGLLRIDLVDRSEALVPLPGQDGRPVSTFALVDDERALVVLQPRADEDAVLTLVDLERGQNLASRPLAHAGSDLAVSPDAVAVAVTAPTLDGRPATVVVVSLPDLDPMAATVQPGPIDLPPGAAWYSSSVWVDDQTVAIGSTSGRIALWRPVTGEVVRRVNDPPSEEVGQVAASLAVSSDGSTLVAADLFPDGSHGSGLMAFDLASGTPRWPRSVRANATFAIDEHNQRVIAQEAGPGSSRAFTYDLVTGERSESTYDTQHGTLCDVVTGPDERRLLLTSCNDVSVGVWALDGATPSGPALGEPGWVTGWNLWDFGHRVAIYDPEGRLQLRDVATRALTPAPDHLDLDAWSWFLADGRLMNVFPVDDEVVLYDGGLTDPTRFTVEIPDQPNAMAWSRDGSILVVGAGDGDDIAVIDVTARRERFRLQTGDGRSLGLDVLPDGSRLFAGSDGEAAAVFDLQSGDRIGTLPGVANTTVSPDGRLVAGSSFDGTITFWDSRSLQPAGEAVSGSTAFSNSLQFTFDGRLLIASGLDNTQRIWDVATRQQLGPELPVVEWTVAIAPDSSRIALNTAAGVQLMDLDRDLLRAAACRSAGRDLTEDEWRRFLGGTQEPLCPRAGGREGSLMTRPGSPEGA